MVHAANDADGEMDGKEALEIHLQLDRAGMEIVKKIFGDAGKPIRKALFGDVIGKCGCSIRRNAPRRPIVRCRIPFRCGDTAGLDIMYPVEGSGHSRPYLIMVDRLSSYTAIARMSNRKPDHAVDLWFKMWAHTMGKHRESIADRWPAFIGNSGGGGMRLPRSADCVDFKGVSIWEWNSGEISRDNQKGIRSRQTATPHLVG